MIPCGHSNQAPEVHDVLLVFYDSSQNLSKYLDLYPPMAYTQFVRFEWDPAKNRTNIEKHGLSFEEASNLFHVPAHLILEEYDFNHSYYEDRMISIGPISRGVIAVIYTERREGDVIRLISARFGTASERTRYANLIAGVNYE